MRQSERAESSMSAYSFVVGDMMTERSVLNETQAEVGSNENLFEN